MAVGLWCCLNGQNFPARIGRPGFGYPLTPLALADIPLHGAVGVHPITGAFAEFQFLVYFGTKEL